MTKDRAKEIRVEFYPLVRISFKQFLEKNNLIIEVREREIRDYSWLDDSNRFYAQIKGAESKKGNMLFSSFSNGKTKESAIKNLSSEIQGKLLVFNAFSKNRRILDVPYFDEDNKKDPS